MPTPAEQAQKRKQQEKNFWPLWTFVLFLLLLANAIVSML
jgi:hypothetical protein